MSGSEPKPQGTFEQALLLLLGKSMGALEAL